MSRTSTKSRQEGWEDQHGSTGPRSYNPSESDYDQKFDFDNIVSNGLKDVESRGNKIINDNSDSQQSVRQAEDSPTVSPQVAGALNMSRSERQSNRRFNRDVLQRAFTSKNLKKRSSLITLGVLLFGGGGFLTVFFSPSLAIIQMKEVFTKSLNDQLHATNQRTATMVRSKLKQTTNGSCGAIKIHCRFATMSTSQVDKYKAAGIEIERDMTKGFGDKRGQITKISYLNDDGVTTIRTAAELQRALLDNDAFRAAMVKAHNPLFAGLSDKLALKVMNSVKATKRLVATGGTDEEKQKKINQAVSGIEDSGAKSIVTTTDKDGKEVYSDGDGNTLTAQQVEDLRQQAERGDNYAKTGGIKSVLSSAVKGVSVTGYMDSACTVFNSLRFTSALAKIKKQQQAIRFAMVMVLTPADSIKAGDATPEDVSFIGTKLTETRPQGKVVDESKINEPGSAAKPAEIDDPDAGKNALNSPGYEMAADDTVVPGVNLRASRFMLAGGSVLLLDRVLQSIATIVNGGNNSPKAVSQKCRYIQNPVVRFGGLAVGVIAGIGSFGLTTALGIAGSVAIALALPYIESIGADILAGNLFQDLSDVDVGDAAYVGAAGLFGMIAMNRGMQPLNKERGMKYLAANRQTYANYVEDQKYLARNEPFNINNQFSFMGSLAHTLVPIVQKSKASMSTAMVNIASLIPTSFNLFTKPAKAVSSEYFDRCNDPAYKEVGIDAGPFCEVRYGMSEEELAIDPLENATWMANSGNIDPASETGDAKDNGQDWNYVKFLDQCAHRKVGWGENQDENAGDGSNCFDPAKEAANKRYRVYTMDQSIDQSMDGEERDATVPQETDFDDGQTGDVSSDGWAFPTIPSNSITRGFRTNLDPNHMGVAIAANSDGATRGQPIFAAFDGTVIAAGPSQEFGNRIVIEHVINGQPMTTVYGRMDDDGLIRFAPGTPVKAGQEIGHIGSANKSNEKPYLYFELWQGNALGNGTRIDPQPYLEASRRKTEAVNV